MRSILQSMIVYRQKRMYKDELTTDQKAPPLGIVGCLTILIPSFLTILMEKDVWLMINRSLIEFKHLSMI